MSEPTPELLQRLQVGDQAALAEFIELRRAPLTAYIQRQLGVQLRRKIEQSNNIAITIYMIVGFIIAIILGLIVGILANLK